MIIDNGGRTEFDSGAVRDIKTANGRCDLLPLDIVSALLHNDAVIWYIEMFKCTGSGQYLLSAVQQFIKECEMSEQTAMLDLSIHFKEGAEKYGEYNWQKGIPLHSYVDSAMRHYLKHKRGDDDEPHDRAFIWNCICGAWTACHKPEMNDYLQAENNDGIYTVSAEEN